ncbi:MAG TPA: hypothetical protein VHD90_01365 [Phototrophicaceae bacterium]|nr:hypothetical protein [Phototrophicaceae bacterium]
MPVRLEWLDRDQTLIHIVAQGRLSPDEVFVAAGTLREMLTSVARPVDVIIDASKQLFFSHHYLEMLHKVHRMSYPNLRLVVFVESIGWEFFLQFIRQVGKLPYQFDVRPTFEQALELIQSVRLEAGAPPTSSMRWN